MIARKEDLNQFLMPHSSTIALKEKRKVLRAFGFGGDWLKVNETS